MAHFGSLVLVPSTGLDCYLVMERSHRVASSAAQPASKKRTHRVASSAAQPASKRRTHRVASSGAQPASKKRTLHTDPLGGASGSAARPATLSEEVEQQVEQLGHYPKRFKTPTTHKERAENSLAMNVSKQWSKLSDATKANLTRLQQETQGKDA